MEGDLCNVRNKWYVHSRALAINTVGEVHNAYADPHTLSLLKFITSVNANIFGGKLIIILYNVSKLVYKHRRQPLCQAL